MCVARLPSPGCHPRYCRQYWNDVEKFLQYAMSKPGVWAVTMSQLLDWMEAPVPAAAVSACRGGALGAGGAVGGGWGRHWPNSKADKRGAAKRWPIHLCGMGSSRGTWTCCVAQLCYRHAQCGTGPHPPLPPLPPTGWPVQMPAFMAKYPCVL